MAENNKPMLSSAKTVTDWVGAYYGTDALDIKKVEKIRHVRHTSQFASMCYVISHNTKAAHTDFFETNYTGSDKTVADVVEFVIKLLEYKFSHSGTITPAAFDSLGGSELFGGRPDYDQIKADYLKADGIVAMCESCMPVFTKPDPLDPNRQVTDFDKTHKYMKELNGDISAVRRDHTYLLSATGKKDETCLSRDEIFSMLMKSTECAQSRWDEIKGAKSGAEKALQKDLEDAFYKREDLGRKSLKVAALGGAGIASLGAIISGVFWPAVILLPVYGLGKKWLPDWFKSMGTMWKNYQDRAKDKRDINRFDAMQKYVMGYAQYGKKYKPPLKVRWYVRKADQTILNKQAKQIVAGLDILEDKDGKIIDSENTIALKSLSKGLGNVIEVKAADGLVPADAVPQIIGKINALDKNSTFQDIKDIASTYKKWESSFPTSSQNEIRKLFAEKTAEVCEALIFETPMDDLNYIKEEVGKNLADGTEISEILKGGEALDVAKIKNFASFASKELTGLDAKFQGKTLKEYIFRKVDNKINTSDADLNITTEGYATSANRNIADIANIILNLKAERDSTSGKIFVKSSYGGTSYFPAMIETLINSLPDADAKKKLSKDLSEKILKAKLEFFKNLGGDHALVANLISSLEVDSTNNEKFISKDSSTGKLYSILGDSTTGVESLKKLISTLNEEDANELNSLLGIQSSRVSMLKMRELSRDSFTAIKTGTLNGKHSDLTSVFSKIGEIKYETVDSISELYADLGKLSPKEIANYTKLKLRKRVYDVFEAYAIDNKTKFQNDLGKISEHLQKINSCAYLDEAQKVTLSAMVSPYVAKAFDNKFTDLTETFMSDYKTEDFAQYLKNYENKGFAELFESDQSPETQILKKSIEHMRDLQDVYRSLKLNDQYDLNKDEAKYIAGSLLMDRSNADHNRPIKRDNNDPLRKFITDKIKNMHISFGTNIEPKSVIGDSRAGIPPSQSYTDLVNALNEVKGMETDHLPGGIMTKKAYDKYTALLILKNKCISLFRLCMQDYVQGHFTGSRTSWVDNNAALINDMKNVWKNGIMKDIDDEIQKFDLIPSMQRCGSGSKTSDELAKYGDGNSVESMLSQRQL